MHGVSILDSSFGGLDGCPFAPRTSGNVATEDMIHMFKNMGVVSKTNLERLIEVSNQTQEYFGFELPGQIMKVGSRTNLHKINS